MTDWLLGVVALLTTLVGPGDADRECLWLGALDAVRVAAFAAADPERLSQVYVSDEAVAADRALLENYADRGLRLRGGAIERVECRVLEHRAGRVRFEVVDRLAQTWVVDEQDRRRELPRPAAERRVVTLAETDDGWRIHSSR